METSWIIAIAIICLLAGVAAGWWAGRNRASVDRYADQSSAAELRQQIAESRADLAQARTDAVTAEQEKARARELIAEANAGRSEAVAAKAEVSAQLAAAIAERDNALARAEELAKDRESLVLQFKNLSTDALKEQGKQADATAEQRLKATADLMAPVREGLQKLNERIQDVEKQRSAMTAQLREQVQGVMTTGENLRRETNALATALRKPQVRGRWGELQLRRVVEISGMLDYCDFYEQTTTSTSADSKVRPDMKVMLGDDKFVFVDSKVPLAAFLDAMETDDEATRDERLHQFGLNVKDHIDKLSTKKYWKADSHSPEFVVLFIPSEALAAEALNQRPDLHEYAAERNIILASPTTLIALLRAVAYGWKQQALAASSQKIFELSRELYDRLAVMGGHLDRLGSSVQSVVKNYNSLVGSVEGRLFPAARKLRDLKLTDKELKEFSGVGEGVRTLQTSELIANASETQALESAEAAHEEDDVLTGIVVEDVPDDDAEGYEAVDDDDASHDSDALID